MIVIWLNMCSVLLPKILRDIVEGEEVRDLTSLAVPVDRTSTASVAPVKAPPVPGVQKPPHRVGKRFRDRLVAAPGRKV